MFQMGDVKTIKRDAWIYQWLGLILVVFAIAAPFIALTGWLKPVDDTDAIWFQRSGAVTTIFSLLTGAGISSILNRLCPRGMTDLNIEVIRGRFQIRFECIEIASLVATVIGTVIWGYGDILWDLVKSM